MKDTTIHSLLLQDSLADHSAARNKEQRVLFLLFVHFMQTDMLCNDLHVLHPKIMNYYIENNYNKITIIKNK